MERNATASIALGEAGMEAARTRAEVAATLDEPGIGSAPGRGIPQRQPTIGALGLASPPDRLDAKLVALLPFFRSALEDAA